MNKVGKTINKKFKVLFVALLLVGGLSANAQIGLPDNDPNVEDVPDQPIDGFLSIGLIAGAAIGLRKKFKGKEIQE